MWLGWEIKWRYEIVEYELKYYNTLFPKVGIKIKDMDELGVIGHMLWKKCVIIVWVRESSYIVSYVTILLLWMLCCSWSMVFMVSPCDAWCDGIIGIPMMILVTWICKALYEVINIIAWERRYRPNAIFRREGYRWVKGKGWNNRVTNEGR